MELKTVEELELKIRNWQFTLMETEREQAELGYHDGRAFIITKAKKIIKLTKERLDRIEQQVKEGK